MTRDDAAAIFAGCLIFAFLITVLAVLDALT